VSSNQLLFIPQAPVIITLLPVTTPKQEPMTACVHTTRPSLRSQRNRTTPTSSPHSGCTDLGIHVTQHTTNSTKSVNMASLTEDGSHRFRKHVTFNNVQIGEPTKNNFPSYTLVVRHLGFYSKRRSRTFMVGIDDHQYSDEALQWLFDKFVEDGDEIICVRVVEKDVRQLENDRRIADFQAEANAEVERIKAKCGNGKAISIVLEYAVGKLHSTFQRLVRLPHPSDSSCTHPEMLPRVECARSN
jgi:hypothetical protein